MSEKIKGFFKTITQQLVPALLKDEYPAEKVGTQVSLLDFISAPRTPVPGRVLLLDIVQKLLCKAEADTSISISEPHISKEPGFSNQSTVYTATPPAPAILDWQEVVAAIVIREQAEDKDYIRRIVHEDVVQNVIACCEDRLINGKGEVKGLLNICGAIPMARKDEKTRMEFYRQALKTYASSAGRSPTHIILPITEILELFDEPTMGGASQEFSNKLFGVPVIVSDAIPEGQGLIIAVDDIILCTSPGLKWRFGWCDGQCTSSELSAIFIHFKMGLLIKRPGTIARLGWSKKAA